MIFFSAPLTTRTPPGRPAGLTRLRCVGASSRRRVDASTRHRVDTMTHRRGDVLRVSTLTQQCVDSSMRRRVVASSNQRVNTSLCRDVEGLPHHRIDASTHRLFLFRFRFVCIFLKPQRKKVKEVEVFASIPKLEQGLSTLTCKVKRFFENFLK